uniref:Uncharacterized protein n=1 Tax=Anguilla anguilla TaxID=7936 RepID=A0A0E9QX28_ANGAN
MSRGRELCRWVHAVCPHDCQQGFCKPEHSCFHYMDTVHKCTVCSYYYSQ